MLTRLFEHNDWANLELVAACALLSPEQLDTPVRGAGSWSIRETLVHLAESQAGYLSLLTVPADARERVSLAFEELADSLRASGHGLTSLARSTDGPWSVDSRETTDGYAVKPWVVMIQVINHATDHRRQVTDRLRTLGVAAPRLDGWAFGDSEVAIDPPLS